MRTIRAAAGIVIEGADSGRVLAVRRAGDPAQGPWEFPGGAIGRGESAEDACRRILSEGLGVSITDLKDIFTAEYESGDVRLSRECFSCRVDGDGPEADGRGLDLRWVDLDSLPELEWAPADAELARALSRSGGDLSALAKRRRDSRRSMQGNKRRDTKPELLVRRRLRAAGLPGYRLQWKKAPGRPDIAYPGRKVAIFVNGCFWHRCPRCRPAVPKRNTTFWEAKFRRNVERDARAIAELEELGWKPIIIWECELRRDRIDGTMERVVAEIRAWSP